MRGLRLCRVYLSARTAGTRETLPLLIMGLGELHHGRGLAQDRRRCEPKAGRDGDAADGWDQETSAVAEDRARCAWAIMRQTSAAARCSVHGVVILRRGDAAMTGPLSATSGQPELGRGVVHPLLARPSLNEEWRIDSDWCTGIGNTPGAGYPDSP